MAKTTQAGYVNVNDQRNLGRSEPIQKGTDYGQSVYILQCRRCGFIYGANGSDIHLRKCPNCQKGNKGIALNIM